MSKEKQLYLRELISTKNISTEKVTYYMVVCDVPRRISKADYDKYKDESDGLHSLSTKCTKTHIRQYCTCTYYV